VAHAVFLFRDGGHPGNLWAAGPDYGRGPRCESCEVLFEHFGTFLVLLLLMANIFNLGADISAMGSGMQLVVWAGNVIVYAVLFGAVSLLLQVYIPYRK